MATEYNCFDDIVKKKIYPHLIRLCELYEKEGHEMILDGAECFKEGLDNDFVYGTLVNVYSRILGFLDEKSVDFDQWIDRTRKVIEINIEKPLDTFGILEFLSAINELKEIDLYDKVITQRIESKLMDKLHWHVFINPQTLEFIRPLAKNYYGVAIRIALLREQIGYDEEGYSDILVDKFFEKVPENDDGTIYMDETNGHGRYDKYSLNVASELSELYILFNKPIPEKIKRMLRASIEANIIIGDEYGHGCLYGRSIGGNASSTVIEVLPLALLQGDLMDDILDEEVVYNMVYAAGKRMIEFWFSSSRGIFNLWDDGKQTDSYRGKHRVLEVNLDLSLKMIRANKFLKMSGWYQKKPLASEVLKDKLSCLPKVNYISYESESYDRGLAVYRGNSGIMMLPIINGAHHYYKNSQYMPIPYSYELISGSSNRAESSLIPKLYFEDGAIVSPIVYSKDVTVINRDDEMYVSYRQDEMCVMNDEMPGKYSGISDQITYRISDNVIERKDVFRVIGDINPFRINMSIDSFSSDVSINGNRLCFGKGKMNEIEVEGLNLSQIIDVSDKESYHTTYGRLNSQLILASKGNISSRTYTVKTTIRFTDDQK